ncbi:hypothetical protein BC835DRAFT_1306432 [Cytidiella melzeri]|nr:hypothetical protein BC835DRAFT_1306432 [Cytidiella melzeri]
MPIAGQSDSWDDFSTEPRVAPALVPVRRSEPVPDDWDDDEDEDEDDPLKVWEDANKKAPMPQLVIASSATSPATVSPPPAAFQPSIRILKRPSAAPSTPLFPDTAPSADAQQKSFVEREADYRSARDRIFGGASSRPLGASADAKNEAASVLSRYSVGLESSPKRNASPPTNTKIIRNPRGPDTSGDASRTAQTQGFRNRKP